MLLSYRGQPNFYNLDLEDLWMMAVLGPALGNSFLANAKFSARLACLCNQLESGNVKLYKSMKK